jgi:hypothetical protein
MPYRDVNVHPSYGPAVLSVPVSGRDITLDSNTLLVPVPPSCSESACSMTGPMDTTRKVLVLLDFPVGM